MYDYYASLTCIYNFSLADMSMVGVNLAKIHKILQSCEYGCDLDTSISDQGHFNDIHIGLFEISHEGSFYLQTPHLCFSLPGVRNVILLEVLIICTLLVMVRGEVSMYIHSITGL